MKMRSRLLILKLAASRALRQIVLTFAAQLTTRKTTMKFPVNVNPNITSRKRTRSAASSNSSQKRNQRCRVVGIDQTLVDIEAKVDDEFIERYGLSAGHSLVIEDDVAEALYQELKQKT